MRKWTRVLLLGALFAVLLCTSALAVDANSGIYDTHAETGYNIVAQKQDKTVVGDATGTATVNGATINFYPETERVKFTISSTSEGQEYLVFILTEQKVPSSGNIVYIDQQTGVGTGGALTFELYPSSLSNDKTYYIYVTTQNQSMDTSKPAGSFKYYAAYTLGDVNNDKSIDILDAAAAVDHRLKRKLLEGNAFLAADVTKDSVVDILDAAKIVDFRLKRITSFD